MFLWPFLVSLATTVVCVAYAALLPQIMGETIQTWAGIAALVFVPTLIASLLVRSVMNISHSGFARLFLVISFAVACIGAANSNAKDVTAMATFFAGHAAVSLAVARLTWWVIQGFLDQSSRKS